MINKIKKFNEYINESVNIDMEIKEYVLNNYNRDNDPNFPKRFPKRIN